MGRDYSNPKSCKNCGHDHSGRRPEFHSTCDWALIPMPGPSDFCRCTDYVAIGTAADPRESKG